MSLSEKFSKAMRFITGRYTVSDVEGMRGISSHEYFNRETKETHRATATLDSEGWHVQIWRGKDMYNSSTSRAEILAQGASIEKAVILLEKFEAECERQPKFKKLMERTVRPTPNKVRKALNKTP